MKQIPEPTDKQIERFWSKVNVAGPDDCWEWLGCRQSKGYGRIGIGCESFLAHRVSFFLKTRQQPGSLIVCHSCDNPACCNPRHLFLGTAADNSRDMVSKGRQNKACGENASRAILTEQDVRAIRRSHATYRELARRHSVSASTIKSAAQGTNWRHVRTPTVRRQLTAQQVCQIRRASEVGVSGRELARRHGVSESTISMIVNRRTWKNVA